MPENQDEESLSDAFWAVARRLRRGSRDSLAPYDLSPAQFRALRVLMHHGSMRLNALSEHLGIAARSTTDVVDALESRGFAVRTPDPSDRRATLVDSTDEATVLMRRIRAVRRDEADEMFEALSPADRAELVRILRLMRDETL